MNQKQNDQVGSQNPSQKKKITKKKFSAQRVIAVILASIAIIGVLGVGAVGAYALPIIKNAPELTQKDFVSPDSSEFLTADGTEYHKTGRKLRDSIEYDNLSSSLIDAFVAAEDSRFFSHNGFDIPRFTKAALNNFVETLRRGKFYFGEGGSTFTMQLIKNTVFVNDGSTGGEVTQAAGGSGGISRKITEIYLSQKLEANNTLNKKLILQLYLNRIDFGAGNNNVGIERSARAYFGKSASELNIVESAFMAGVINAPFANSPYFSIENANEATQRVLYNMHYHGYITDTEYDVAKNVRIEDLLVENDFSNSEGLPYQAYIDAVYDEVIELTKSEENPDGLDPTTTPMRVYTAIDLDVQAGIDEAQARKIASLDYGKDNPLQAASAVVNNQTGEIIGLYGGYDYNGMRLHNRATKSTVNPGSTLKPVVSYAAAYEYLGWSSNHVITDEPYNAEGTDLVNYDGRYLGQITVQTAVGDSRNIPAVKAFTEIRNKISDANYIEYLRKLGLTETAPRFGWGYAIGNNPFLVTPVQMAGATATLFNEGAYIQPHTVLRIEFKDGRDPLTPKYEETQVLSPGAAYLATRNMKYVVDSGLNSYTNPLRRGYTTFAKTGTVQHDPDTANLYNLPKNSQKDRLMIAATKDYTIATWVGFDELIKGKSYFSTQETQFNLPGKLNSYILNLIEKKYGASSDIAQPNDLVTIKHITGVFPYQAPLDNMNPDLISSSLILKKYAKLEQAKPQALSNLSSMNASATDGGNTLDINVQMTAYPDASKLEVADKKLVMTGPNGKTYTGQRLFDESWIYGAVRYKTEIRVNGTTVKEVMSEKESTTISIPYPSGVNSVQVCSYYTFELSTGVKSNEVCKYVSIPEKSDESTKVPNFIGKSFIEVLQFANQNNMPTPTIAFSKDSNRAFGTVVDLSPNISGNTINSNELSSTHLNVVAADKLVESGIRVRDFMSNYANFITVSNSDVNANSNKTIAGYNIGGNNTTSFWLGEHYGGSITLIWN